MRIHQWPPLALLLVFGFAATGCSAAYGARYQSSSYGHAPPRVVHHETVRYAATAEYRRIQRDADAYADFLDRELHLNGRQERDIERLLVDRAEDLLRQTPIRYHAHVYPFPRTNRSSGDNRWWSSTDSGIERMLNPRQRSDYRRLVYALEHRGGYGPRGDWDGDRGRGR